MYKEQIIGGFRGWFWGLQPLPFEFGKFLSFLFIYLFIEEVKIKYCGNLFSNGIQSVRCLCSMILASGIKKILCERPQPPLSKFSRSAYVCILQCNSYVLMIIKEAIVSDIATRNFFIQKNDLVLSKLYR